MSDWLLGTSATCPPCSGCGSDPCTPPVAPAATIYRRTSSASLTKFGHDEYGTPSTPPKIYLKKTQNGLLTINFGPQNGSSTAWSGLREYARPGGGLTDTMQAVAFDALVVCSLTIPSPNPYSWLDRSDVTSGGVTDMISSLSTISTLCDTVHTLDPGGAASSTSTQLTVMASAGFSGSGTVTLSDEYTTALLEADVTAALPAFSGSFAAASPTATYDVSTDEKTVSKSKAEYKFVLPSLTGYACYTITWTERFTPEGGGSPTDTAMSYTWNGTDTETPVYTMGVPGSQGTTTIVNRAYSCVC